MININDTINIKKITIKNPLCTAFLLTSLIICSLRFQQILLSISCSECWIYEKIYNVANIKRDKSKKDIS